MAEEDKRITRILRTTDLKGHKVWVIFNNPDECVWGKKGQTKEAVFGVFASKYDVHRPLTGYLGGAMRLSEAAVTIAETAPDWPRAKHHETGQS